VVKWGSTWAFNEVTIDLCAPKSCNTLSSANFKRAKDVIDSVERRNRFYETALEIDCLSCSNQMFLHFDLLKQESTSIFSDQQPVSFQSFPLLSLLHFFKFYRVPKSPRAVVFFL